MTTQQASEVILHAKEFLLHQSLNCKMEIHEYISDMNANVKLPGGLEDFGKQLPESRLKRGNVHMALIAGASGGNYLGVAKISSACMEDNR